MSNNSPKVYHKRNFIIIIREAILNFIIIIHEAILKGCGFSFIPLFFSYSAVSYFAFFFGFVAIPSPSISLHFLSFISKLPLAKLFSSLFSVFYFIDHKRNLSHLSPFIRSPKIHAASEKPLFFSKRALSTECLDAIFI